MTPPSHLPKLAFFHVMKTGGMTFRETLNTLYGNSVWVSNETTVEGLRSELDRFDCVEYHVMPRKDHWIHPHESLVRGRRWDLLAGREVFTMLRDPVDRFVSQYYYVKQQRPQMEPILHARGKSFPESILELWAFDEQVGFLSAKRSTMNTVIDRSDLELAKEMLLSLRVHVGLTERFADSMNVFETVTGLTIPGGAIQIENRNSRRRATDTLSAYVRDRIRERNLLDLELYEFGKELFQEEFARCKPTRTYSFVNPGAEQPAQAAAAEKPIQPGESNEAQHAGPTIAVLDVPMTRGSTYRRQVAHILGESYHFCDDPSIDGIARQAAAHRCLDFGTIQTDNDFLPMHASLARQDRWDLLEGRHVFTMLRDPVEYVVTRFVWMQNARGFMEPHYAAKGVVFPASLDVYVEQPINQNNQLGYLTGKQTLLTSAALNHEDLEQIQRVFVRLGVHVGVTDRFDDCLRLLESVIGGQVLAGVPNLDRAANSAPLDKVPAGTLARIRELNALDLELYEFGRRLFFEDLKRYGLDTPANPTKPAQRPKPAGVWASLRAIIGRSKSN